MILSKLVISNLTNRKARTALTALAVLFSVSLVVATTTAYASLEAAARHFMELFAGTTDAQISRRDTAIGGVPESIVHDLNRDPRVQRAAGRLDGVYWLNQVAGLPIGRQAHVVGISRPLDEFVNHMTIVEGGWFEGDDGNFAVVDQETAVGQKVRLNSPHGVLDLKVVGVIRKPEFFAKARSTIYVPLKTLQKFMMPRQPPGQAQVSWIIVDLKRAADGEQFAADWTPRLAAIDPLVRIKLTTERRQETEQHLEAMSLLSMLGGSISMVAAIFIVFTTLSMGVAERQRVLAMLRAVGATRGQIGRMVVIEGVVLATLGCLFGAPLGVGLVKLLSFTPKLSKFFVAGVHVGWQGIFMAVAAMLAAAVLASLMPAWQAMRISPLAAMNPLADPPRYRSAWLATAIGLLLIAVDPFMLLGPLDWLTGRMGADQGAMATRTLKLYFHVFVGVPGVIIGVFLLAPLVVLAIDGLASPALSRLMGVRPILLRQQLSSGLWRAAGTASAMMVGLAVLIVMQVLGRTVVLSWRLPDKFPDLFIVSHMFALDEQAQAKVASIPGIRRPDRNRPAGPDNPPEIMRIGLGSPELASSPWALPLMSVTPNSTMFIGIEPDMAGMMMDLDFRDGNATDAWAMVKKGRHVIVTEEFRQLKGLKTGDPIEFRQPLAISRVRAVRPTTSPTTNRSIEDAGAEGEKAVVRYGGPAVQAGDRIEIRGAEDPAFNGTFTVEQADGSVFRYRLAKPASGPAGARVTATRILTYTIAGVVWSPGLDVIISTYDMHRQMDQRTGGSVLGSLEDVQRDFGALGVSAFAVNVDHGLAKEEMMRRVTSRVQSIGLGAYDVRAIKYNIQRLAANVLNLASTIAIAAMVVASLGVINTVMAGIRSRQWNFGILRSVGLTRGHLLRLVLCEAMMLGTVGVALGLGAGFLLTLNARGLHRGVVGFVPPLVVPWDVIAYGAGAVLALALLASLAPAIGVARRDPLALLSAGRGAM